ncbi:MAG: hypothetical protein ABJ013_05150 [Halioglobus sp.]
MTMYELADYTNSLLDTFLTSFTIFMSIVTAYVVTAFVAGDKLTKFQQAIVNVLFLLSTGVVGLLAILTFRRFFLHAVMAETPVESLDAPVDFTVPLAILFFVLVSGAMTFMWSVRQPRGE